MRRNAALALLVLTGLSACGGTTNRGLSSIHQPVVARTDYVFDMAAPGDRMGAADVERLNGWFDSLQLRYGDRVSVDTQGYGPAARDSVAGVAARYGLLVDATAPVTQGPIAPGAIRVIVSRMSASVPSCPDFSRTNNPEYQGSIHSNYGCATNTTLAAMIADPRDLVQGRGTDRLGDNGPASTAIRAYRAGTIKPLPETSTRTGK